MRRIIPVAAAFLVPSNLLAQLSYVEATGALGTLGWDGGRTVLQFADLNADGHLDLVTVGDHGSPFINTQMHGFTIWFGNGAGGWTLFQTGNFGYGGVAAGDLNNDGKPDLAYGVHHNYSATALGNQVLEAALNDGTGMSWTPWDANLGLQGQTWGMFGVALADINSDGWLDLFSDSFGCCDGIHAYLNNTNGTWTPIVTQLGGNSTMDMVAGDVNNDGHPDFATAHQSGSIRLNNGSNGFTLSDGGLPAPGTVGRRGPDLRDVNGDGRDDFSFVNSSGGLMVWLRTAAGGWTSASAGLPTSGLSASRLFDMDGDGFLDLVGVGSAQIRVWRGDGGATWTLAATIPVPTPGTYSGMAIADVDRNGRPDIAIVTADTIGTFNTRNKLRLFKETSPSPGASITVETPPTQRVLRAGSTGFVAWRSSVAGGATSTVDLEVSLSGAGGPWLPLTMGVHNTGRAQYGLPAPWSSTNAYIRASLSTTAGNAAHVHGPLTIVSTVTCYPDCNSDGALNLADFGCFQSSFALQLPYADCNADGLLNLADFGCFQSRFALGCP